ncbi:hypothetical protein [Acinetobacter phage HFM1]|nr:hypothetical protein [Acinetobacter phage HFM1]
MIKAEVEFCGLGIYVNDRLVSIFVQGDGSIDFDVYDASEPVKTFQNLEDAIKYCLEN